MSENRILYLDALKVIAIFFVICIHVVASLFLNEPVNSALWNSSNFLDSISRWSVPVFVMVSGALMLRSDKELSIKKLYSKKISRLVIGFLVWSLFYAIVEIIQDGFVGFGSFLESLILGKYHLWFIFMIIELYVLTPTLRAIAEKRSLLEYTTVVCLVLMFLQQVGGLGVNERYAFLLDRIGLNIGFIGYYLLGYLLYTCSFPRWKNVMLGCVFILGFLITYCGTHILSIINNNAQDVLYGYCTINVAVMAIGMFAIVKGIVGEVNSNGSLIGKALSRAGDLTLGVYFIHVFLIEIIGFNASIYGLVGILLYIVVIFSISYLIAFLLRKMPLIGKCIA